MPVMEHLLYQFGCILEISNRARLFLYSAIKSHSVEEIESMKIWYDTITDKYFLSLQYDKTKIVFEFYIYLYEWSHLVLSADFSSHVADMYLIAAKVTTKTTNFVHNRVIPVYQNSFLRIGDVGTFDIDDLKFLRYTVEPSQMYGMLITENLGVSLSTTGDMMV